jgi:Rps23 Pro-64 3,4-dihydroxylase Tpa1-like proline 4-hydroxylase
MTNRNELANLILKRLEEVKGTVQIQFDETKSKIGYFFVDDLLPVEVALQLSHSFPETSQMVLKKSIREDKFIGVQMNKYDLLLEETIYAFQDERVVQLVSEITGLPNVFPDQQLYAGGISLMKKGQYLNPHLDNSHDKDRDRWRVLNLLYYVTPNWNLKNGGNLELWPNGLKKKQVVIESKFNRLAVMVTHNQSLHSVSPVTEELERRCISNYYFSNIPARQDDTFHVTSFRGRPENKFVDMVLQTDTFLRMGIRKIFKKGIKENPHYYKKGN